MAMILEVRPNWHSKGNGETREVKVGDIVFFLCNGRGRGGHYMVHAKVTKINLKTVNAIECKCSYSPNTHWKIHASPSLYIVESDHITLEEFNLRLKEVPKMTTAEQEEFRRSNPFDARTIDRELAKVKEEFPDIF